MNGQGGAPNGAPQEVKQEQSIKPDPNSNFSGQSQNAEVKQEHHFGKQDDFVPLGYNSAQNSNIPPPLPGNGDSRHHDSSSSSSGRSSSKGDDRDRDRSSRRRSRSRDRDRRSSGSSRSSKRSRSRDRDKSSSSSSSSSRPARKSKSPSPPPRRKRKFTLWDQAPTGMDMSKILAPPVTPAPTPGNPHQSRQARRLYIGNIPAEVGDHELAEFVSQTMYRAGKTVNNNPNAVVAVQMNREKSFAFIEFNVLEDANAGMNFDGMTLKGHALKVRRPKDYRPPEGTEINPDQFAPVSFAEDAPVLSIVSTNVQEGPNKIFIGGLPSYLNEEQVKELLTSFGPLKSFNLVKDSATGNSKGFAFFEYLEAEVTDKACNGLNGMKLGEKTILVQRANVGAKHSQPDPNASSLLTNPTALNFLNLGMPIAAACALLSIKITDPGTPSRVVQLCNLISAEDIQEDEDYNDIVKEITQEASRFGTIASMWIPRPPPRDDEAELGNQKLIYGLGRVFLEYNTLEEAVRAQEFFAGRKFNARTIISGFLQEARYERRDVTPDPYEEQASAERFRKIQELRSQQPAPARGFS